MINYGNLLDLELIEIGDNGEWIRPVSYINPDANEPLQGVGYSSNYCVDMDDFLMRLRQGYEWGEDMWLEHIAENQYLSDNLTPQDALKFLGITEYPIIELPRRGEALGNIIKNLKDGCYLVAWTVGKENQDYV